MTEEKLTAHDLREIAKASDALIMKDVEKILSYAKKAAEAGKYSIDIGKNGVDQGEVQSLLISNDRGYTPIYPNFEIKRRIEAMLIERGFKVWDQKVDVTYRLFPDDPNEPTSEEVSVWIFRVSWL